MSDRLDRSVKEQPSTKPCGPCTGETLVQESMSSQYIRRMNGQVSEQNAQSTSTDKFAMYGETDTACGTTGKVDKTNASEKFVSDCILRFEEGKTPVQRLQGLEKLAGTGVSTFTAKDEDGRSREYSIELLQTEGKTLLHCYSKDETGQRRVVMRACVEGNGHYSQQTDQYGAKVGYYGDWWSVKMREELPSRTPMAGSDWGGEARSSKHTSERSQRSERSERSEHSEKSERSQRVIHSEGSSRKVIRGGDSEEHGSREKVVVHEKQERRSGIDLGRVLGTVAQIAAPFVMNGFMRNNSCNDGYGRYDRYDDYHHQQRFNYGNGYGNSFGFSNGFSNGSSLYSGYSNYSGFGNNGGYRGGQCHDSNSSYFDRSRVYNQSTCGSSGGILGFFTGKNKSHGQDHHHDDRQRYKKHKH